MEYFDTRNIGQLDQFTGMVEPDDLLPIYLHNTENRLSNNDNDPVALNPTKSISMEDLAVYFTPAIPEAEIQIQGLEDGSKIGSLRTRESAEEQQDVYSIGEYAFAQGKDSQASGPYSYAGGKETQASGLVSHTEGTGTIAAGSNQTVIGKYNVKDTYNRYSFIIGNGQDDDNRSNALTINWQGQGSFAGDLYTNNQKVATESYVNQQVSPLATRQYVSQEIDPLATKQYVSDLIGQRISSNNTSYMDNILDKVYPIGSIYMSMNNVDPGQLFGGVWEPLAPGRMLLGTGVNNGVTYTAGATGGSKDAIIPQHAHTTSCSTFTGKTSTTPNHYHTAGSVSNKAVSFIKYNSSVINAGLGEVRVAKASSGSYYVPYASKSNVDFYGSTPNTDSKGSHYHTVNHNHSVTVNSTGSSVTNANMPPYLVVYMWQRVEEN